MSVFQSSSGRSIDLSPETLPRTRTVERIQLPARTFTWVLASWNMSTLKSDRVIEWVFLENPFDL